MASSSHRGHSKAQTCFFKILRIISSHSPTTKPIDIDLNLTLSADQHQPLPDKPSRNQPQPSQTDSGQDKPETPPFGAAGNCLDLLIEAARVLDESEDSEEEEDGRGEKRRRKERWVVVDLYGGAEEREPVVRSKRGRNQALPCRFRDSVVEPLKRATRSHRPSSTAQLATRRLLRSSSAAYNA